MADSAILGTGGPIVSPGSGTGGGSSADLKAALTGATTGILTGGLVTLDTATTFDVAAGVGQVMDFSDPENPVPIPVPFGPFLGESPLNIGTAPFTTLAIDATGALIKSNTLIAPEDRRNFIRLQSIATQDFATITDITEGQQPAWNLGQALLDYIIRQGPLNTDNDFGPNVGANLSMDKTTGLTSQPFINFINDPDQPNDLPNPAQVIVSFTQQFRDGGGGYITTVPVTVHAPSLWDDGSGVLAAVAANRFTVKRIIFFGQGNATLVTYGQAEYMTLADAEAAIFTENPDLSPLVGSGCFCYALVIKTGTTDLNNVADAKFVRILSATSTGSGGGTSGDLQSAYVQGNVITATAVSGPFRVNTTEVVSPLDIQRSGVTHLTVTPTGGVEATTTAGEDFTVVGTGVGDIDLTAGGSFLVTSTDTMDIQGPGGGLNSDLLAGVLLDGVLNLDVTVQSIGTGEAVLLALGDGDVSVVAALGGGVAIVSAFGAVQIDAPSGLLTLDGGTGAELDTVSGEILIGHTGGVINTRGNLFVDGGGPDTVDAFAWSTNHTRQGFQYQQLNVRNHSAAAAETVGFAADYLATGTATIVDGAGYVAGVDTVSNPTVVTLGAAVFAAGDIISIVRSPAAPEPNDGFFEVITHVGTLLTIRGVGVTDTVEDWSQRQFETLPNNFAAIRKVNISVLRAGTDGDWEVGKGSTTPLVYTDLATAAVSTSLQAAYVVGNSILATVANGPVLFDTIEAVSPLTVARGGVNVLEVDDFGFVSINPSVDEDFEVNATGFGDIDMLASGSFIVDSGDTLDINGPGGSYGSDAILGLELTANLNLDIAAFTSGSGDIGIVANGSGSAILGSAAGDANILAVLGKVGITAADLVTIDGDAGVQIDAANEEMLFGHDDTGIMRVRGEQLLEASPFNINGAEELIFSREYLALDQGYTTTSPQTGGLAVNFLPTATSTSVAGGGFTPGVAGVSNPTIITIAANLFSAGQFIQVAGSRFTSVFRNDGFYEVLSHVGNVLTLKGVGLTDTVEGFTRRQVITATAGVDVRVVNISVLRAGVDGNWEQGKGTTAPLAYIPFSEHGLALSDIEGYQMETTPAFPDTLTIVRQGKIRDSTDTVDMNSLGDFSINVNVIGLLGIFGGGGAAAANTTYHMFIIRRTDTGQVSAGLDTSFVAANIPNPYTQFRRIGSIRTDGTADIFKYVQMAGPNAINRKIIYSEPKEILTTGTSSIFAATTTAASDFVPEGAHLQEIDIFGRKLGAAATDARVELVPDGWDETGGYFWRCVCGLNSGEDIQINNTVEMPIGPSRLLRYRIQDPGDANATIVVVGYTDGL